MGAVEAFRLRGGKTMTTLRKFRGRGSNLAFAAGLCAGLTWLPGIAEAADQASARELAAICAQSACRTEKIIELRAPKDNVVRFKTEPGPYAYNGALTIYPNERYAVRLRVHGKELGEPVFERGSEGKGLPGPKGHGPDDEAKALRDTASVPVEGLIYFSFKQQEGTEMVLEIVSTLPVSIKYDAVIFVATPGGIQPDHTSSCPVFSGAASVEKWPVPLTMLALSNFRVVDARTMACQ